MNKLGSEKFSQPSLQEDLLIRSILLTHDPDPRRLDSAMLLQMVEESMFLPTTSQVLEDAIQISDVELVESEQTLTFTIYAISRLMLCKCYEEGTLHTKIMALFETVAYYNWDAKAVLILAALAMNYNEFWLMTQQLSQSVLASSLSALKGLSGETTAAIRPRLKAMGLLFDAMVEVAQCVVEFEGMPFDELGFEGDETMLMTKSWIYIATYWILGCSITCSSQFTNFGAMKHEYSNSTILAIWELSSLACRLSSISSHLKHQVDFCREQIETRLKKKLEALFKERHVDNQEVLHMLLAMHDDLPLKDGFSKPKLGIYQLKDKVIILLISTPQLLSIEETLFLVQQTYNHSHYKEYSEQNFEIVWLPISPSSSWTKDEKQIFEFLSNSLPWLSMREPWKLHSGTVEFIIKEWNYNNVERCKETLMVVLDTSGVVSNTNAMDMVSIWGAKAFPFSSSREEELWGEENWSMQLLINGIDPLLTRWVEEGKNICIFGSENHECIREFNDSMNQINKYEKFFEVIYVGSNKKPLQIENCLNFASIKNDIKNPCFCLDFAKSRLLWLRQQSIKRSALRFRTKNDDFTFITDETEEIWAIFGRGSLEKVLKLQGRRVILECLNLFPIWGENVKRFGLVGAIKTTIEPSLKRSPCNQEYSVVPYDEKLMEGDFYCENCKCPLEKFVMYKCEGV